MRFAYNERSIMRKSSGEPKSIEAEIESSNSEEQEQTEGSDVPQADEPPQEAAANVEGVQPDAWGSAATIGGARPNKLPTGANLPRAIRPKTSFLQRSRAQPMFISVVTRRSF